MARFIGLALWLVSVLSLLAIALPTHTTLSRNTRSQKAVRGPLSLDIKPIISKLRIPLPPQGPSNSKGQPHVTASVPHSSPPGHTTPHPSTRPPSKATSPKASATKTPSHSSPVSSKPIPPSSTKPTSTSKTTKVSKSIPLSTTTTKSKSTPIKTASTTKSSAPHVTSMIPSTTTSTTQRITSSGRTQPVTTTSISLTHGAETTSTTLAPSTNSVPDLPASGGGQDIGREPVSEPIRVIRDECSTNRDCGLGMSCCVFSEFPNVCVSSDQCLREKCGTASETMIFERHANDRCRPNSDCSSRSSVQSEEGTCFVPNAHQSEWCSSGSFCRGSASGRGSHSGHGHDFV